MDLSSFVFDLPKDLISSRPSKPRGSSKLLVVDRKSKKIELTKFENIVDYLVSGDLLVFNDTKVDPVLLLAKDEKNNSREILLVRKIKKKTWTALTRNPKETKISFSDGSTGYLTNNNKNKEWRIIFDSEYEQVIEKNGRMPIPPYINREPDDFDLVDYPNCLC